MQSNFQKFTLMLWKNYKIQLRKPFQTFFEISTPILFSILLIILRSLSNPNIIGPFLFSSFSPTNLSHVPLFQHIKSGAGVALENDVDVFQTIIALYDLKIPYSVIYSPNSSVVGEFFQYIPVKFLKGFPNGASLEKYFLEDPLKVYVAIQFDDNIKSIDNNTRVKIRFPAELRVINISSQTVPDWRTHKFYPQIESNGPREFWNNEGGAPGYFQEGFLTILYTLGLLMDRIISKDYFNLDFPKITMKRFAHSRFHDDPLLQIIARIIGVLVMLSFVYTCMNTVKAITVEKEKQIKETMKIMGLPTWLYWTAWFARCFLVLFISTIISTILLKVKWFETSTGITYGVLSFTNGIILFIFLILYCIAAITFCFLISTFFNDANTAGTVAGLVWFLTYVPFSFLDESTSLCAQILGCLALNTAMSFGFQVIFKFEGLGTGSHWTNLFRRKSIDDYFTLGYAMIMLIIDSMIYLFLAIYVDEVCPGRYGVPKKWYYLFDPSYWIPMIVTRNRRSIYLRRYSGDLEFFEPDPPNSIIGVQMLHIQKEFGSKMAVRGVTLNMFKDQITVLLGHDGAGKTTTISMLTGMVPPTKGTAVINKYDIRFDMDRIRSSLGFCPQNNILFDYLTVREHLYFFSKMKGLSNGDTNGEIEMYITMLDLRSKESELTSKLSGGMKRSLCVAVALCGKSEVVLLDEPTTGVDLQARRLIWELLNREKNSRTILLCTHFMDEADILGDRIAIMAGGKLQCCGSSVFLKNKFGSSYYLTIEKGPHCNSYNVTKLLSKYIETIKIETEVGTKIKYLLPKDTSNKYESMLNDFENMSQQLDLAGYRIALTELEEIFLKVGADKGQEETYEQERRTQSSSNTPRSSLLRRSMLRAAEFLRHSRTEQVNQPEEQSEASPTEQHISNDQSIVRSSESNESFKSASSNITSNSPTSSIREVTVLPERSSFSTKYSRTISTQTSESLIPANEDRIELYTGRKHILNQFRAMFFKHYVTVKRLKMLYLLQLFIPVLYLIVALLANKYFTSLPELLFTLDAYPNVIVLISGSNESRYYDQYIRYLEENKLKYQYVEDMDKATLELTRKRPIHTRRHYLIGASFKDNEITAYFNNDGYHIAPLALISALNTILNRKFQFINHPFPYDVKSNAVHLLSPKNVGFQIAFSLGFTMAFVGAFFIIFYISERTSRSKHLQFVSGTNILVFWVTSFIFDLILFIILILVLTIVLICFNEDGFNTVPDLLRFMAILLFFAWHMLPLLYVFAYCFDRPASGYTRMVMFNIMFGNIAFLTLMVLKSPALNVRATAQSVERFLLIWPHYCLSTAIMDSYISNSLNRFCGKLNITKGICRERSNNYFKWEFPGIGRNLYYALLIGTIFYIIVLIIELHIFSNILTKISSLCRFLHSRENLDTDRDVLAERTKVHETNQNELLEEHVLVLKDLTKYYKKFLAVNSICLAVKTSDCFGLLGVNGAGKTTTFEMMTGGTSISSGDVWINTYNLQKQIRQVHKSLGYCPQFDALLDTMSVRETLKMYCLIRGVPSVRCKEICEKLADDFDFSRHLDKMVGQMSGGNKRKLSTAIAFIGDPLVILLDEPTNGMDPGTKQIFWNNLIGVRNKRKCIVISSHSMEECEAVCTRLAIMVKGTFQCIGSAQHLKKKFAKGYILIIKKRKKEFDGNVPSGSVDIEEFIEREFQGIELVEKHYQYSKYKIREPSMSFSQMFGIMEKAKKIPNLNVEYYSLGQCTLEEVFWTFSGYDNET